MADKYLKIGSSNVPEEQAAITTSAGAGDSGKIPALNSAGKIDPTMLYDTVAITATASENLAAGDLVNLFDSTGLKMRKADASGGTAKMADGFVLAAVTSGASGTVYFDGVVTGLSSLTVGAIYFLSSTAGAITTTPSTTATHITQKVGKAKSTTELIFEPTIPIVRA